MPKLSFTASESEGWKPLPAGTYAIMFDSVQMGASSGGHPQMRLNGHVDGGNHDGKKVTIFYVIMAQTGWKLKDLLFAAGVSYEETDTGEVNDEDKPIMSYEFDPDDLPGQVVEYDVKMREYQGKEQNNFTGEKAPEKKAAKPAAGKPAATVAVAAKPKAKAAAVIEEEEGLEEESEGEEGEEEPEPAPAPRRRAVRTNASA